mmetsp:Transcript_14729/g.44312  ORF Transcript_14729/g.44312 Transcript_14729/m.44312 type:complete len:646 (+) Transcript_14729:580-2517(+)
MLGEIHLNPETFGDRVTKKRTLMQQQNENHLACKVSPVDLLANKPEESSGYEVVEPIGKGQFSLVYKCRRRRDGKTFALKHVSLRVGDDGGQRAVPTSGQAGEVDAAAQTITPRRESRAAGREMRTPPSHSRSRTPQRTPRDSSKATSNATGRSAANDEHARLQQCLKEVSLLKDLAHENIVAYIDCVFSAGSMMMILEWVDGGDLKRYLKRLRSEGEHMSPAELWSCVGQITSAVEFMHQRRIIHRDIKPGNIFITSSGKVKVGDLGLSRFLNLEEVQAFSQVGTPLYMSPEVLKGKGYTFSSDLWSLGCVFFEMVELIAPFYQPKITFYRLVSKILNGERSELSQLYAYEDYGDDSRELVERLVAALLTVDAGERMDIQALREIVRPIEIAHKLTPEMPADHRARFLRGIYRTSTSRSQSPMRTPRQNSWGSRTPPIGPSSAQSTPRGEMRASRVSKTPPIVSNSAETTPRRFLRAPDCCARVSPSTFAVESPQNRPPVHRMKRMLKQESSSMDTQRTPVASGKASFGGRGRASSVFFPNVSSSSPEPPVTRATEETTPKMPPGKRFLYSASAAEEEKTVAKSAPRGEQGAMDDAGDATGNLLVSFKKLLQVPLETVKKIRRPSQEKIPAFLGTAAEVKPSAS